MELECGSGYHLSAQSKLFLQVAWNNLRALFKGKGSIRAPTTQTGDGNSYATLFKKVTGFSYKTIQRITKEFKENKGQLKEPDQRGRKPRKIEDEIPAFEKWVLAKIKDARTGGFLTLQILQKDGEDHFEAKWPLRQIRLALHRCGLRYCRRRACYVSKRNAPKVQEQLKAHCAWIHDHCKKDEATGRYYLVIWDQGPEGLARKMEAVWMDESFLYSHLYRAESWCEKKDPTRDSKKRGDGKRLCLVDSVFSLFPEGWEGARVSWSSTNKTARGEHKWAKGKYVTAEHMLSYFTDCIFSNMSHDGVVIMDNAATHKAFKELLNELSEEELVDWISEAAPQALKKDFEDLWKTAKEANNKRKRRSWLMRFVREHRLRTLKLQEAAEVFYQGKPPPTLKFLPPYHPELNPTEAVWRRTKAEYYRLRGLPEHRNPDTPWQVLLEEAYKKVDEVYLKAAISNCICWALSKHAEFCREAGEQQAEDRDLEVGDEEASEDSDASDADDGASEFGDA